MKHFEADYIVKKQLMRLSYIQTKVDSNVMLRTKQIVLMTLQIAANSV